MNERIEKVKEHLRENKKVYLVGGLSAAGIFALGYVARGPEIIQVIDAIKIQYKSPTTNNITTVLVRRGHPGNIIKCDQTGELFASQRRAGEVLDLNHRDISAQLAGLKKDVKGKTFTKLGEAQAA